MNPVMAATYSCGWVTCGMWPAPANVLRVAFGRTAASLSSTIVKKGGVSEPSLSSTGPRKPERAAVSMPRISGSGLIEESRGVVDQHASLIVGEHRIPGAGAEDHFVESTSALLHLPRGLLLRLGPVRNLK